MVRGYVCNDYSPPSTSEGGHDSQQSGDVLTLRAFELEQVTWILSKIKMVALVDVPSIVHGKP